MNLRKLTCLTAALGCLLTFPAAGWAEDPAAEPLLLEDMGDAAGETQPSASAAPNDGESDPSGNADASWTFPVSPSDLVMENLVIASRANPLTEADAPADLVNLVARRNNEDGVNANGGVYLSTSASMSLRRSTADMLFRMFEDAESQGVVLYVKQGYRSYADEVKRAERAAARGETSDEPGTSDFQTGMGVVIVGKSWRTKPLTDSFAQSEESLWLAANAARYGFVLRYPEGAEAETGHPYTPWHYRYVGMGVSRYMADHALSLEAFRASADKALADFAAAGGSLETVIAASKLPEGPVVLSDVGEDGDPEVSLFHD